MGGERNIDWLFETGFRIFISATVLSESAVDLIHLISQTEVQPESHHNSKMNFEIAVKNNDLERVKSLIEEGFDVNLFWEKMLKYKSVPGPPSKVCKFSIAIC